MSKMLDLLGGEMLTEERFAEIEAGEVFATGLAIDTPTGLHMTRSGRVLRFIARKGYADDWAVYCHFEGEHDLAWIGDHGDKVRRDTDIRHCVPCDDATLARYRR